MSLSPSLQLSPNGQGQAMFSLIWNFVFAFCCAVLDGGGGDLSVSHMITFIFQLLEYKGYWNYREKNIDMVLPVNTISTFFFQANQTNIFAAIIFWVCVTIFHAYHLPCVLDNLFYSIEIGTFCNQFCVCAVVHICIYL